MSFEAIMLICGLAAGAYMAWNIGANDVANAMASAVGAKAITLGQAVIIAGVLNIIGATFIGSHVTQTIRMGIVDVSTTLDPHLILIGLLAALIAAALWVFFATIKGLPVSTTHSIVGAVVGFGLIVAGPGAVHWGRFLGIVVGWVLSPIMSGIAAFFLFRFIEKLVLARLDTLSGAIATTPVLVATAVFVMTLSLFLKTPLAKKLGVEGILSLLIPLATFIAVYILVSLGARILLPRLNVSGAEDIFRYLQVMTSCYVALAQGANDVANAMGPLSGIYFIVSTGSVALTVPIPSWMLSLGGVMIAIGIFTWGYRVIETVGSKITELNNSRGFTIDFSTATVILGATMLGLPVSTTHAALGAYVGVGLARGLQAIDLGVLWKIMLYWLITVPITAAGAAVIYIALRFILLGA
ncbi:MAG: inorganic phosphate transporter [Deltaproteobacteria bacterium]